jgi:hypothetical protein
MSPPITIGEVLKAAGVEQLNLDAFLTVPQAAKTLGVHPDTIRRNYKHILDHLSPGRRGIRVRKLFAEIDKKTAA